MKESQQDAFHALQPDSTPAGWHVRLLEILLANMPAVVLSLADDYHHCKF